MTVHRITLIPGDGAGPELVDAARAVVEATGVEIEWDAGQRPGIQVIRDADALAAGITAGATLSKGQVDRIVALLDPRQPLPRLSRTARAS